MLQHLLSNYAYSLEVGTTSSGHPIDEFLFTRKTGYCEHYATAMVLMLRSIGIPVATGDRILGNGMERVRKLLHRPTT